MSLLHAHLVFVTKYRRAVFTDAMLTYCEHTMRSVCARTEVRGLRPRSSVKANYRLWVTPAERDALSRIVEKHCA